MEFPITFVSFIHLKVWQHSWDFLKGVSGKYYDDFEVKESSEESRDEEVQKQLYELSARYCHLDGYEPLEAPPPPVKTEKVKAPKKAAAEPKEEENKESEGEESQKKGVLGDLWKEFVLKRQMHWTNIVWMK